MPPPPSFPRGELELALSEQSFGITSYEIMESTDEKAVGRVVLLEGSMVSISLTERGYTVQAGPLPGSDKSRFETVDDLLQSVSEEYRKAWQKSLFDKLTALQ